MESSKQILLVEDSKEDIELTMSALEGHLPDSNAIVARDGAEALAFLFGEGTIAPTRLPRAVLLALKLPKVDGLEVLRRIRADARTRRMPVVVLTSSGESSDVTRCYDLGVNSYIVKPVDFESFMPAIEQAGLYWLLLNQTAH